MGAGRVDDAWQQRNLFLQLGLLVYRVLPDLIRIGLGIYTDFVPRHAKRFANLADAMHEGVKSFVAEVMDGSFPAEEHGAGMDDEVLRALLKDL